MGLAILDKLGASSHGAPSHGALLRKSTASFLSLAQTYRLNCILLYYQIKKKKNPKIFPKIFLKLHILISCIT